MTKTLVSGQEGKENVDYWGLEIIIIIKLLWGLEIIITKLLWGLEIIILNYYYQIIMGLRNYTQAFRCHHGTHLSRNR